MPRAPRRCVSADRRRRSGRCRTERRNRRRPPRHKIASAISNATTGAETKAGRRPFRKATSKNSRGGQCGPIRGSAHRHRPRHRIPATGSRVAASRRRTARGRTGCASRGGSERRCVQPVPGNARSARGSASAAAAIRRLAPRSEPTSRATRIAATTSQVMQNANAATRSQNSRAAAGRAVGSSPRVSGRPICAAAGDDN